MSSVKEKCHLVRYSYVPPLFLASRSTMRFFRALILGPTSSSKRFRSGLACSLKGVREYREPVEYTTGLPNDWFRCRGWLLTLSARLLEDSASKNWRGLLVGSRLAFVLVRDSTLVSGRDVWTWFHSSWLTVFVSLATASLITIICGLSFPFWFYLPKKLCGASVSFGRVWD